MTSSPPIAAHRVLADGRSIALLQPGGEIDWWCAPKPDDPPLLWSLLDPAGAAVRWCDVRMAVADGPLAGPAARSVLQSPRGRLESRDGLLSREGRGSTLVRLVRALDDELDVTHELSLGGFDQPWGTWSGGVASLWEDEVVVRPSPLDAVAVLRACTYAPTGAVVAAPTTSLPEAPGHDRQFDYRYTWLRDASLAVSVAGLLGHRDLGEEHLRFIVDQASDARVPSGPMTAVEGDTVPEEREVDGVAGWAGSRPVRVGNAAADQVQFDALGTLVESVSVHLQMGGRLTDDVWSLVRSVADAVAEDEGCPSGGIWELREPRPLVSGDIGRWMAPTEPYGSDAAGGRLRAGSTGWPPAAGPGSGCSVPCGRTGTCRSATRRREPPRGPMHLRCSLCCSGCSDVAIRGPAE